MRSEKNSPTKLEFAFEMQKRSPQREKLRLRVSVVGLDWALRLMPKLRHGQRERPTQCHCHKVLIFGGTYTGKREL